MVKLDFTKSALGDLLELASFYESQGVPAVGQRFVKEIIAKVERLKSHPDSGRIVPEFGVPFLREIIHPPFRVVYRRDPHRVSIVRVWRSERLMHMTLGSVKGSGPVFTMLRQGKNDN